MNSVSSGRQVPRRLDEVGRIHVGHEPEGHVAGRVMPQRLVRHDRPEVGAADADIDDVLYRLAGKPLEFARTKAGGEVTHTREHGVDLRHDVLAVHHERGRGRQPQRGMQHGPVLRDVDVLAPEHRVPPFRHPDFLGQLDEQRHRLVGDPVLRVVQVNARGLGVQPLAAPGVGREQVTQVRTGDFRVMALERLPRFPLPQRGSRHAGLPSSSVHDHVVSSSRSFHGEWTAGCLGGQSPSSKRRCFAEFQAGPGHRRRFLAAVSGTPRGNPPRPARTSRGRP